MSYDPKPSMPRGRLIVSNPDSESSDEDYPVLNHPSARPYRPQLSPLVNPLKQPINQRQPERLTTTDLTPAHVAFHQPSHPQLSSPSSTSSPAAEESTPPPSTPSLPAPSSDLSADVAAYQDPAIAPYANDRTTDGSQIVRRGKYFPSFKSPFPGRHPKPSAATSSRRPATSPTVTTPDSYSSISSHGSTSTVSDNVIIVVTADSERYVTVNVSAAKNSAFIRECIFSKLNIFDEDDQRHFSIYQTEIGAFAIGDALTDEKLFELCRDHGDSKGSLKFFVSHSSAPVHELPPHSSNSLSPAVNTIPPPVLPQYPPLRPRRRSRSRQGSLSSASEQIPPEGPTGYDADVDNPDRDTHRIPLRPPVVSIPSSASPHPHHPRRPSGPPQRPSSPLRPVKSETSPPIPPERPRVQGTETALLDKYGQNMLPPPPPPPPPFSPNRLTFDDNGLQPPTSRGQHSRSGSDAGAEREQTFKTSEQHKESSHRLWRHHHPPYFGGLKARPSKESMAQSHDSRHRGRRQPNGPEDPGGRSDSWVVVPPAGARTNDQGLPLGPQDNSYSSPSTSNGPRQQTSPSRYKQTSPYVGLVIPNPPRQAPPAVPPSSNHRTAAVPVGYLVTWKGEEKGDQKTTPTSSSRLTKGTKSMDNLRAHTTHPPTLQPGMPRLLPAGNGPREPNNFSSVNSSSGLPKSYEHQRWPTQVTSHGSSQDFSPAPSKQYGTRVSQNSSSLLPSHDPYTRPQSALDDTIIPPAQRHSRHQPTYNTLDSGETLTVLSPNRQFYSTGVSGSRLNLNYSDRSGRSPDTQGGIETRNTPPHSPASPRSPRHHSHDRHGNLPDTPSSSSTDITPLGTSVTDHGSESTLKQEDRNWLSQYMNGDNDGTFIPPRAQEPSRTHSPPPPSTPSEMSSPTLTYSQNEDSDSGGDDCGTMIWKKRPMAETPRPKSILRGPMLEVQVENLQAPQQNMGSHTSHHPTFATPPVPPTHRPVMPPPIPESAMNSRSGGARGSTFTDMRDNTWAPRPPPEDVYERLEEFFPEHDLDKPVIEASSGGTSPTAAEPVHVPVPPVPLADKSRVKGKKSIRIVAEEHKKRIDRTSKAESSAYASVLRKRSTKLWGSRLEEVTTVQAKSSYNPSLPESPSGGPTTFKWVRGELIGRGTYGRVYLALNATTGEMIAVKQVETLRTASDKNDSRQVTVVEALKMESETLKDLDHPNIVQYLGFEETPANLSIFLEYVPGGSVGSCLLKHGKFDEEVTKSFTGQILSGLEYLHSKGILHRDLKADNILVEMSGVCKISDFGISKRTDDSAGGAFTAMQGTVFWMAPEVINTQKKAYNFKIDIWSLGCVVLEMWAGMRPWNGDEVVAVMFKLYQSKLPPPVPADIVLSDLADNFRRKCFAINPEERPTAAELRKHPYLELAPGWVFTGFK